MKIGIRNFAKKNILLLFFLFISTNVLWSFPAFFEYTTFENSSIKYGMSKEAVYSALKEDRNYMTISKNKIILSYESFHFDGYVTLPVLTQSVEFLFNSKDELFKVILNVHNSGPRGKNTVIYYCDEIKSYLNKKFGESIGGVAEGKALKLTDDMTSQNQHWSSKDGINIELTDTRSSTLNILTYITTDTTGRSEKIPDDKDPKNSYKIVGEKVTTFMFGVRNILDEQSFSLGFIQYHLNFLTFNFSAGMSYPSPLGSSLEGPEYLRTTSDQTGYTSIYKDYKAVGSAILIAPGIGLEHTFFDGVMGIGVDFQYFYSFTDVTYEPGYKSGLTSEQIDENTINANMYYTITPVFKMYLDSFYMDLGLSLTTPVASELESTIGFSLGIGYRFQSYDYDEDKITKEKQRLW